MLSDETLAALAAGGLGFVIGDMARSSSRPAVANVRPLFLLREPSGDHSTVAARGAELPSGTVIVEWYREGFPEGEQTEHVTESRYGSVEDAEQATGLDVLIPGAE